MLIHEFQKLNASDKFTDFFKSHYQGEKLEIKAWNKISGDALIHGELDVETNKFRGRAIILVPGKFVEVLNLRDNHKDGPFIRIETNGNVTEGIAGHSSCIL